MVDTILSGDVSIAYFDENRQKRIYWTGGASTTYTMNELYSALMNHFDEALRMDNPSPMSAQTPVEYTTGIIDTGDNDPWYVSYDLMEHMTGGALRSNLWTRTVTSATGIVVVPVTASGNTIVAADAGNDITHADGDSGTLLEVISDGGATDYLVVRPDSSASGDNFDSTSGTLTCNANTGTQAAAATTGEQIWANTYAIGTIEPDTHIYFYQGDAADGTKSRVYSVNDNTQDYWGDGLIDVCIPIRDYKSASNPVIDSGYLTGFARKYSTEFSFFEAATSTTSGGRNPIPLGTKDDLNNDTGIRTVTLSGSAGGFSAGDEVQGLTSGARAIVTATSGSNPTLTLVYYLVGDPLTDFNGTEGVDNLDDVTGSSSGSGAPADAGPATTGFYTGGALPTISFTAATADIDDDTTDEFYGVTIDCNQARLTEVYEFLKLTTRRGETGTTNTDGIEGEQYIGADYYLAFSGSVTGTVAEGADVTQANTGATGTIISYDASNKVLLLRNSRGTFNTTDVVTDNDNSGTFTPDTAATSFAPNAVSPFGTFAGGTFFGARGVLLTDYNSLDENAFQLTTADGLSKQRPTAISLTVANTVGTDESTTTDDRIAIFRLTGSGGDINKAEYSASGGEAIGDATLTVDTSIAQDVPGKSTGGVLRLRDASDANEEYRIRYSSWTGSVFTLANVVPANLTGSTDSTTLVSSTDELDNLKRGDLVLNVTRSNAVSYVTSVNAGTNTVTISPAISGQVSTDTIEINAIPVAIDTLDDVYVPLMDRYATASSESVSLTYSSQIFFRVVARNSENTTKIIPFTTDDTTTGTDRSNSVVRIQDTIIT
jgi:hypothetical protein